MCKSTNYLWVYTIMTNLMATRYIVNFVNKLQKTEEKDIPSPVSTILITKCQNWNVCIDLHLLY